MRTEKTGVHVHIATHVPFYISSPQKMIWMQCM